LSHIGSGYFCFFPRFSLTEGRENYFQQNCHCFQIFLCFLLLFWYLFGFIFPSLCLTQELLLLHPMPLSMLLQAGLLKNARKWTNIFKKKLLGRPFQMRNGRMHFHAITFKALRLRGVIASKSCKEVVLFLLHFHLKSQKIRRSEILKPIESYSMQFSLVFLPQSSSSSGSSSGVSTLTPMIDNPFFPFPSGNHLISLKLFNFICSYECEIAY